MKKIILAAMACALALTSCSKKKNIVSLDSSEGISVAMVTDSGDITDQSFNQTTYEASKAYCAANGLSFNYYKPAGDTTAARVQSINAAINDEYNVIILPGYLFSEAIVQVADKNEDVIFIGLDVSESAIMESAENADKNWTKVPDNVFCAVYTEEIPGFMAGYAAVKEGYRHLGYLGGMAVPAVERYGYGFVQGADVAAKELGVSDKVEVEYVYGGQFYGDQQIKASMDGWYQNRGVEVVFACGGGIYTSACDAAKDVGGKVIGVDVDQSERINKYAPEMCVTSAMKGLGATVKAVLKAITEDNWDEYAGKILSLGLVSATDIDANYVQLPTATWSMKNFTVDDYKALVAAIYEGKIAVSNDIAAFPKVSIKATVYPNIK